MQVDQGLHNISAASYDHPHSEYFSSLASGGSICFIFLMQLFLIPVWLFVKYIKKHESDDIRRLSLAGLLLIIGFMAAIYGQQKEVVSRKFNLAGRFLWFISCFN